MAEQTARLAMPLLEAGQAQKEIVHNEALTLLDALVQPAVETCGDNDPPADAVAGKSWIVGPSPTGAWTGQAGAIATWTDGGWRFAAVFNGAAAWVVARQAEARFSEGEWTTGRLTGDVLRLGGTDVVGMQQPAIADPAGGGSVDDAARASIAAILAALRNHGLIAR